VTTSLRRTRRLRGSRMHGWGRSGQHRGSGQQGGHGNAGWKRHKWSWVIRYGIQIQERGFTRPNKKFSQAINIGDLDQQIDNYTFKGFVKQVDGKTEVNLPSAGYTKLLSRGTVNKPLRVLVYYASERAAEKITAAGGEIVPLVKAKEE